MAYTGKKAAHLAAAKKWRTPNRSSHPHLWPVEFSPDSTQARRIQARADKRRRNKLTRAWVVETAVCEKLGLEPPPRPAELPPVHPGPEVFVPSPTPNTYDPNSWMKGLTDEEIDEISK
jgi:hypothetical protein